MTKRLMDEIYPVILEEMEKNNIEDTTENRIAMLQGLRDGWRESVTDEEFVPAFPYMMAVSMEILMLTLQIARPH